MFSPKTGPQRCARYIAWVLLVAHTFWVALVAWTIYSKPTGWGWWTLAFVWDIPASYIVYGIIESEVWCLWEARSDGIWVEWLKLFLFAVVGSLWVFLLPTAVVRILEVSFSWSRKSKAPECPT